jgi:hypothetical protein
MWRRSSCRSEEKIGNQKKNQKPETRGTGLVLVNQKAESRRREKPASDGAKVLRFLVLAFFWFLVSGFWFFRF